MIDEKKLIEQLKGYKSEWKLAEPFHEGIASGLQIAIEATEKQPKVGEWISCYNDMPDHKQEVMVKLDDDFICKAKFYIATSGVHCIFHHKHIGALQCPQVVAWMPLPEPYKEEAI